MTTWNPLPSSGGGLSPVDLAPDILAPGGGLVSRRGQIIDYCDFDNGSLNGWSPQMWNNKSPVVPVTAVTYPTVVGSHALQLVLQDAPYVADNMASSGSAYKRLVNYSPGGLKSLSVRAAVGSSGEANEPAWMSWGIGMDIQRIDNSTRGFFKLACVIVEGTPITTKWVLINDAGNQVDIPGSASSSTGENENKVGWNYVRLTIDDTGTGSYYEAQINGKVFDLRSLGAGRGAQTPQAGDWMADYRGGCNPGAFINQRETGAAILPWPGNTDTATLTIDESLVTFNDKAAS